MSLKKLFVATTIALSSGLAMANNVSYDYVQGGLIDYDNLDGVNFEFSKSFTDNIYGKVDYSDLENGGFDVSILRLNAGFNMELTNNTDFVAELGYEDIDADFGFDDSGYNMMAGIRSMFTNDLEVGAYVSHSDVLESTDITFEGRYHFDRNMSVALEIGNDDELDEHIGINFRYSF
ncbi:MAG: hypothetical protein OQJ95_05485 [Kangiella sp.]|jgi:hypothetical protein|nr:hypothetical protein [Kangiella sp.]MCW9029574.1 hypothetical protein [Kangiella sp.]